MSKYQKKKEQIINEAIEWQKTEWISEKEVYEKTWYFFNMAKRYGLIREFQENGII